MPDANADSAWLMCHVIGCERGRLLAESLRAISPDEETEFFTLVKQRQKRVPLQRITGRAYFMGLEFAALDDVLIPRQDTELLCEKAVSYINKNSCKTALDLCSGSGAIAVCLAKLTHAAVTASDISPVCISAIDNNARRNSASVEIVQSDLFAAFTGRRFDVITCNPPYIPDGDRATVQAEVAHDPDLALYSGADGLDIIRRLAIDAPKHINDGGRMFLEFGDGQQAKLGAIFASKEIIIHNDMQNLPRVAEIIYK